MSFRGSRPAPFLILRSSSGWRWEDKVTKELEEGRSDRRGPSVGGTDTRGKTFSVLHHGEFVRSYFIESNRAQQLWGFIRELLTQSASRQMKWRGVCMNRWMQRGGVEEEWHLLSGDQTAALKHAELISFVSARGSACRCSLLSAELHVQLRYVCCHSRDEPITELEGTQRANGCHTSVPLLLRWDEPLSSLTGKVQAVQQNEDRNKIIYNNQKEM